MNSRRFAHIVTLIALCALLPYATAYASAWQQIKKSGKMIIGIEGTYAPFDFLNKNNKLTGFDVDFARAVGKDLGVKVKFVTTEWSSLIGGLNANKFDAIAADMSITPEREKSVDFTTPYNAVGAVLICRKDNDVYHSLADLKGAHVGTGIGTTFATLAKSVPSANVSLYNSFPAYLQDLMNGRLDVIINSKLVAGYMLKTHDYPLKICSGVLNKKNPGMIAMAVKQGNKTLLKKLNGAIKNVVSSPKYKSLYNRWFGPGEPLLLQIRHAQSD